MCDDCGQEDPNVSLTVYLHFFTTLYLTAPYQPEQLNGCGIVRRPQLTVTTQHTLNYTWKYILKSSLNCTVQDKTFCIPLEGLTEVYKCTHYAVYKKGLTSHTHVLPSVLCPLLHPSHWHKKMRRGSPVLAGASWMQRSELAFCFLWSLSLAFY